MQSKSITLPVYIIALALATNLGFWLGSGSTSESLGAMPSVAIGLCVLGLFCAVYLQLWHGSSQEAVDPWQMQAALHEASGQAQPRAVEINADSILYGALIMEETAETFLPMVDAMRRASINQLPGYTRMGSIPELLAKSHETLTQLSLAIRSQVQRLPHGFKIDLTQDEAVELADGSTDVMVVGAGFAVASGVPGPACYLDVGGSNLSKRNPDTMLIDKDPSGKWIKGRNYHKPDLRAVLVRTNSLRELS